MSDAKKIYTGKLANGHAEDWTQAEYDAVKDMTGDRFSEYTVEPIQPAEPADVAAVRPPRPSAAATTNAATPAA